jgi:hypothetical protein
MQMRDLVMRYLLLGIGGCFGITTAHFMFEWNTVGVRQRSVMQFMLHAAFFAWACYLFAKARTRKRLGAGDVTVVGTAGRMVLQSTTRFLLPMIACLLVLFSAQGIFEWNTLGLRRETIAAFVIFVALFAAGCLIIARTGARDAPDTMPPRGP